MRTIATRNIKSILRLVLTGILLVAPLIGLLRGADQYPQLLRGSRGVMSFLPEGAVQFQGTAVTQRISVLDNRDVIAKVPRRSLLRKWRFSGGLAEVSTEEWRSDKYRYLPPGTQVANRLGTIQVLNSLGYYQPNTALLRSYPDGTVFADVLSNKVGIIFEVRIRSKKQGRWSSKVTYEDSAARPRGYSGLTVTCASCHSEAGTGGYGEGLVPGGDTVFSDPLPWSLVNERED